MVTDGNMYAWVPTLYMPRYVYASNIDINIVASYSILCNSVAYPTMIYTKLLLLRMYGGIDCSRVMVWLLQGRVVSVPRNMHSDMVPVLYLIGLQ